MDCHEPTKDELLAALGCLIEENDALRAKAQMSTLCWGRRSYTADQLEHGHDLAPRADISTSGLLVVRIES